MDKSMWIVNYSYIGSNSGKDNNWRSNRSCAVLATTMQSAIDAVLKQSPQKHIALIQVNRHMSDVLIAD